MAIGSLQRSADYSPTEERDCRHGRLPEIQIHHTSWGHLDTHTHADDCHNTCTHFFLTPHHTKHCSLITVCIFLYRSGLIRWLIRLTKKGNAQVVWATLKTQWGGFVFEKNVVWWRMVKLLRDIITPKLLLYSHPPPKGHDELDLGSFSVTLMYTILWGQIPLFVFVPLFPHTHTHTSSHSVIPCK